MNFTLPTTKAQMHTTLKSIYAYYRLNTTTYVGTTRQALNLTRMVFTPLTQAQLNDKAEDLILPEFTREKKEKEEALQTELKELQTSLSKLNEEYSTIFANIDAEYETLKESIKSEGVKKGLSYSSYLTEKLYQADLEKAQKTSQYQSEKTSKTTAINSEITAVQTNITNLTTYFNDLKTKLIDAKVVELTDEQDKIIREVFKYNNSLDEKEKRYANANLSQDAELEVKFMELTAKGLSKESLVDLGYYSDVIACINGYFGTLSASTAYQEFKDDGDLALYLESYYQDILYLYKTRAQ